MKIERESLLLLAPAIYLFVLPLAHTTALRSIAFGVSALLLFWTWRAYATPPVPLKAPFAAWLVIALLSLIWAIYPEYSIGEIKAEIIYGFLSFLIFFRATRNIRELNLWIWTLAASALLVGTLSFIAFIRGSNPYDVGMHGGTLYYAGYINTILPLFFAMAILRTGLARIALLFLIVFLVLTAYGTTSRAVWICLLLELFIFGGVYIFNMDVTPLIRRWTLAATIVFCALFSMALLYVAKEKLNLSGGPIEIIVQTTKSDLRPKLWADSISFIRERPLTGAGFGRMVLGNELVEQQKNLHHTHAHNIVLNYALQLGLLGPIVLFFLFLSVVREFWKLVKSRDRELKILGIAGLATVGGVLGQGMVEDIFVRHLGWLFWALIGMTLGYASNVTRQTSPVQEYAH